jgi:hypothetical protein
MCGIIANAMIKKIKLILKMIMTMIMIVDIIIIIIKYLC